MIRNYEEKVVTFKRYANAFYGHNHLMEMHALGLQGWILYKNTESTFTFRRMLNEEV